MIFFADRYHLRKYGRMVTNDNYLAMKHGPVPSTTKDIAESNDYLDDSIKRYSKEYIEPLDNLTLKSISSIDESILSESDLEALQFAWDTFGHLDQFQLRDTTHLYQEWRKHKDELANEPCLPMDILDFLRDPIGDADKCFELTDEVKLIRSEQLTELAYIESLWGHNARCPT